MKKQNMTPTSLLLMPTSIEFLIVSNHASNIVQLCYNLANPPYVTGPKLIVFFNWLYK